MSLRIGATNLTSVSSGSTVTTSQLSTSRRGASLMAYCVFGVSTQTFTSLTDTYQNTWKLIGSEVVDSGGGFVALRRYQCANAIGGTGHIFTLTLSGVNSCSLAIIEILPLNQNGCAVDQQTITQDNATPFDSGGLTPIKDYEMLTSVFVSQGGTGTFTNTPGNSFTLLNQESDSASFWIVATAWRLVTSGGTYAASWTTTGTPGGTLVSLETLVENASAYYYSIFPKPKLVRA